MSGRLDGKTALVTGAGSMGPGWGNGKAAAVLFARQGAKVLAVDLNKAAAEETAGIIRGEGGQVQVFAGNVTDRGGVRVAAKDLDGDGHPEIVAGSGQGGTLTVYKTVPPGLNLEETLTPFAGAAMDGVYVG